MPTPARMLTVVHLITGLEIGGAERMLAQLATRIDRDRFTNVVVSMTGAGKIGPVLAEAGIAVESLGMRRGVADPSGLVRLLKLLRRRRPQVLQTWLYHADLLGLIARWLGHAPGLIWNLRCSESIGANAVRRVLSRFSSTPDAVIVNSLAGQRFHQQLGYRPKRWEYIPNGIDTGELRPDEEARRRLRGELRIDDDMVAIGLPARYHPMKDHATFLAAAARLAQRRPGAVFLLAGTGVEFGNRELARAIAGHGLTSRVRLLGERRDISAVYPAFDIATLSSAFGEGWPNVIGEAMACGVPCAATDSGDSAAIIGATGLVAPPRDAPALAAAWEQLVALGPEGRRSLGAAARERIFRCYGLAATVGRYEALYDEISGQRGKRSGT
ncbi:MAG TPA: glycosyltransferase [Stellaceae bacterium]|jgi:glycosyltransferase involved in cell wall biosynthesis